MLACDACCSVTSGFVVDTHSVHQIINLILPFSQQVEKLSHSNSGVREIRINVKDYETIPGRFQQVEGNNVMVSHSFAVFRPSLRSLSPASKGQIHAAQYILDFNSKRYSMAFTY